jgi:2-polyprenyl-6-methoxyphenol hydroxylase-like FAD-dependent oxidoreductase
MSTPEPDVDRAIRKPLVVVVGSGPTGLATALELGSRSIDCLVVERNPSRGHAPRAKTTHARTRELLRRWGLADRLAAAAPFGLAYPTDVHFVTRLSGYPLAQFRDALQCAPGRDERYSEHGQWIPQYKLEAVLREGALELDGVALEYGTEFVSCEQDADSVRVAVRSVETGAERTIVADYLVGADGARSAVREAIGVAMEGRHGLSRNYNIIFQAPGLAEAHPHGPGVMYWQVNEDSPSVVGPMDQGDLWFFMPLDLPADAVVSDAEAVALIKRATGIDLPYRILSADLWTANRLLASAYRVGRTFLAGDACHLHPPYGGYGMNMGVADGVDLGWKLAAAIAGWGGPRLLDSYEIERRQVHEIVLDEAEANHVAQPSSLSRPGLEDESPAGDALRHEVGALINQLKAREFYSLGITLGLRYRNSPVISPDGSEAAWERSLDYVPSAAPGCIAPHAWLDDGSSLYDHFGPGFTLLAFAGADTAPARRAAAESGVPLKVLDIVDPAIAARYERKMVLVRPDQHVAWRGDRWPDGDLLGFVSGRSVAAVTTSDCEATAS